MTNTTSSLWKQMGIHQILGSNIGHTPISITLEG